MKFSKITRSVLLLTLILSSSLQLYSADPVVTSVSISPVGPYVPSTMLMGAYSYFDADGDLEDFPADRRWYSSPNASGTPNTYIFPGSTYQVSNGQRGNYIAHAVRVHDTSGASSQFTFSQWYKVNTRPVASNDNYANWVSEGQVLNVPAGAGVLSNDTDIDAQTLSAVIDTEPTHGTLTLNSNGSFVYTHDGSENHNDVFSYRAYDGMEYTESTASVFISVTPVNDAPVFTTTAPTSAQQGQLYEYNIVTTDAENQFRAITSNNTLPSWLSLQDDGNGTGLLSGTPLNGDDGIYNISLRVNDFNGGVTDYNYTLTVSNVDDPPVLAGIEAQPLAYQEEDPSKSVTSTLTVDDPDDDAIISATFTFTSGFVNSEDRLTFITTSGFSWTPNNLTGVYVLSGTNSETAYQNAIRNVTYRNINLDNPVEGNRTVEIVVATAGAPSNEVVRTITVTGVNDPPEALADVYSDIPEGGSITTTAGTNGVLDNDNDPDDLLSALTAQVISSVSNGVLNFSSNGSFTYTHDGSEELSDGFTYTATDGEAPSEIVTVTLNMVAANDPPVLQNMETNSIEFTEDGTTRRITNQLLVTDEDDTDMESATITIDQGFVLGEDSLMYNETAGLTVSYNHLTGVISATGTAPKSIYQTFLRNIRYTNTNSGNPNVTPRRVRIIVNDGDADSEPVYRNISITPIDDLPIAENAALTAANFHVGAVTTLEYDYSDPENDPEGNTTFRWFSSANSQGTSPSLIASWNIDTFTLRFSEGGRYVRGIVTPKDINGITGLNDTTDWEYVNAAPVFSPFAVVNLVNPGAFAVGQTVSVNYTYTDMENDQAGIHQLQWYRSVDGTWENATPINNEEGIDLDLTQNLNGNYIAVQGIPYAQTGSSPGMVYKSLWWLVSEAPNAILSGSDSICNDGSNGTLTINLSGSAPWSVRYYIEGTTDTILIPNIPIEQQTYELNVSDSGTYKLLAVSDAKNGFSVGTVSGEGTIAYYPEPSAELLVEELSICDNDESDYEIPIALTGTPPWDISYQYSGDSEPTTIVDITEDTYNILVGVEGVGVYTLLEVSDANCTATGTGITTVSLKENPKATFANNDTTVCAGEEVALKLNFEGNGPWVYRYTYNGGEEIESEPITQTSHSFTISTPGTYRLIYIEDQDDVGCAYGTVEVENYMLPTATISGNDSTCAGTPKLFPVQLTGQAPWDLIYQENTETPDTIRNIVTSPYQLSTVLAGNYTILSVEDKNCVGTGSGIANLKVNALPEVSILDMDTIYSLSNKPIPIFVEPEGGNFELSDVPKAILPPEGAGYMSFYTIIASILGGENYSPQWIRYTYTDPVTECAATAEHVMYLLAEPVEIQLVDSILKKREMFCFNYDPIEVVAVSAFPNSVGSFSISGNKGMVDKGNNKAIIVPEILRSGQKTLTYSVEVNGELLETSRIFSFEEIYGDFNWDNECFSADNGNAIVTFSDNSSSFLESLVGYDWKFFVGNDTLEFYSDTAISPTVTFPKLGRYDIEYVLTSEKFNDSTNRCYDTIRIEFILKPTRDVGNMPYDESFSDDEAYWSHSRLDDNIISRWKFGKPTNTEGIEGIWDNIAASEKAWYTKIDTVTNADDSYIISPCFDFTNAERPMIKMDLWRRFAVEGYDGAVLEYTTDNGENWSPVGSLGDGINWYNRIQIQGTPGDQEIGWADVRDNNWVNVRHKLDYADILNSKQVRFRIAYGSIGDQFTPRQGLAVDNIWIGERTKKVLVEHFTNASDELSAEVNPGFNALLNSNQHQKDVIDIQYHLGEPTFGYDPFYELSDVSVNSRSTVYDISNIPFSVIDGGKQDMVDYQDNDELQTNVLIRAALLDNLFEIDLEESFLGSNYLDFTIKLTANENISDTLASLHVAIIESNIEGVTGNNGETEFKSVLKAMVPSAIGTPVKNTWSAGESQKFSLNYQLEDVYDVSQLRYVVFVQNDITKEVYQAEIYDPNVSPNSLWNERAGEEASFSVYPNPTENNSTIALQEPFDKEVRFEINSSSGALIYNGVISAGETNQEIRLNGLMPGVYYIKLESDQTILGTRKLVKIGNNR